MAPTLLRARTQHATLPTIKNTRAGYGVYTLGADNKAHYFFVS